MLIYNYKGFIGNVSNVWKSFEQKGIVTLIVEKKKKKL